MPFIERQITVTITLQARQGAPSKGIAANATPTFEGTGSNTVRINGGGAAAQNGLRISAKITRPGAPSLATADLQIYNLSRSIANQISTLGVPLVYMVGANSITIQANDVGSPPTTLFTGTINTAWLSFDALPDGIFNISAQSLGLYGSAPAKAASFKGSSSISSLMGNLAPLAGLKLVNLFSGGASEPMLSNQYLSGSLRDQIRMLAKNAGIAYSIDDVNHTLTIGPKNGSLTSPGESVPIIGPPPIGNMVGYPSYTAQGLRVKTEFTSDIGYGKEVIIKGSSLPAANGKWIVYYLDYDLECQAENGPWFTNLELAAPDFPVISQQG